MALESMTGCNPPLRAHWLRALFLERERIANHLGDAAKLSSGQELFVPGAKSKLEVPPGESPPPGKTPAPV